MLISYNWLKELTGTRMAPQEVRERLTMVGLAIDSITEQNGDSVLDVEVPSNRPDCLSHIGIAREVAAIENGSVEEPKSINIKSEGKAEELTSVQILDPDLCGRYAARLVRGVKIAPSPAWLARRLEEIGQRPINNVADITNYVLHEMGQPLHAFDFAKLEKGRIVVRRARAGEVMRTLDGVERKLDPEMLVIADASQPVALAGIMGGEESEISPATVDVLIESAYFNPDSVRRTARRLGMDTEASRRFERGADCENVLRAQTRCVELICEIAGGVASENAIDAYPVPAITKQITFRPARVEALTSVSLPNAEMVRILNALGFASQDETEKSVSFTVPSWRVDVSLEEDLIEEVVRHAGYQLIDSTLPPSSMAGEYQPAELKRRAMRRALAANGFDEAINFSFIEAGSEETFALLPPVEAAVAKSDGQQFVQLENPIIEAADRMRPSLLPGLLESLRRNLNHGNRDVKLFENGRIFAASSSAELPQEVESLALIATGGAMEEGRAQAARELDFIDLRGSLEVAIDAMRLPALEFRPAKIKHLREGQAATVHLPDGVCVGTMGRLAEPLVAQYKFKQAVYVSELDLDAIISAGERAVQYRPLPRYPSVVRDLTLLLDRRVTFAEVVRVIEREQPAYYRGTKFVGTYEGEKIPEGKIALTIRIEYRADDRTLRDEEVEDGQRVLVAALVGGLKAEQH